MAVLDELVSLNPNAQWWIKGDGTDIVKGLCQSVSGQWSGDVSLDDGKLQHQYTEFCQRIEKINAIGISRGSENEIRSELLLMADADGRGFTICRIR